MNEHACEKLRVPITIDDYMNSRMIADPIRLLDCVMRTDGAAGLLMMSRKRAKEKGLTKNIIPIGYAELTNYHGRREPGRRDQERPRDLRQEGARRRPASASRTSPRSIPTTTSSSPSCCRSRRSASARRARASPYIREHELRLQRRSAAQHRRRADFGGPGGRARRTTWSRRCGNCAAKAGKRQVKDTTNALVTGIGWINYGRNWGSSAALVLVPE